MSFPRYPAYKDSGVEWLGEVPEHWEALPLRRLIRQVSSGTSVNAIDEPASPGQAGVLKTSCVYTGKFRPEENKAILESELDRATCTVVAGSLVVSRMNTPELVGAAGLVKNDDPLLFLPDRLWLVSFQDCDPQFMNYWCKSVSYRSQVQLACSGTSSSMQNLSQDNFYSFIAPLSPTGEQSAIAIFLDHETAKIDALIAEQQRLIELLQEKRQAVISHAVTKGLNPDAPMKDLGVEWLGEVPEHWEVTQLRHYSKSIPGFAFPSAQFVEDESQWKLLRGINVGVSYIRWDEVVYWEREEGDQLDQYVLAPGDLVVGLDRPQIKEGLRVARVLPEDCPCLLLQRVAAVKGTMELATDYLYYLLSSPFFIAHFEPDTTGVSVPHISTGQIDSFVIPKPPKHEQQQIVSHLTSEIRKIKELTIRSTESISLLKERRSALISAAVTGQIDVRGLAPGDEAA